MSILGTGPIGSVSGVVPFSSVVSYDFFSGILAPDANYSTVGIIDFGKRCKEIHIINPSTKQIQFRFEDWFGTAFDGGAVETKDKVILRNCNRQKMQIRCDGGSVTGVYVMAF